MPGGGGLRLRTQRRIHSGGKDLVRNPHLGQNLADERVVIARYRIQ